MQTKKKILLTGASGFLGWHFCRLFSDKYQITGTYFRNQPDDIDTVDWRKINLIRTPELKKIVQDVAPDIVIHLAAIANVGFCEEHPALSHHINVYTTVALAEISQQLEVPMIFSSTDMVFNGASAPYSEDDFCYPLSQYGIQKQMAEDSLLSDFEHTIIARLPLLFGQTPSYGENFYTQSIQQLKNGEKVTAFVDEVRTTLSGPTAARGIERLIQYALVAEQPERLLHLSGNTALSRYDFLIKVAQRYNLDENLIVPTHQQELNLSPTRPADVSLTNNLAKKTIGFQPINLDQQLEEDFELNISLES